MLHCFVCVFVYYGICSKQGYVLTVSLFLGVKDNNAYTLLYYIIG